MSRVLKGGVGPRVVPQEHIFDAKQAAQRIVRQAQEEADRVRAQAAAEGRERGLAAVTELLSTARAASSRAQQNATPELRVLAVRIAEKILGRELTLRPEAVVDIAREALASAGTARQITLRCHPDDLAALERGRPRLLERASRAQVLSLRADPNLSRGGCIIETELATIDARLSTQLDAIERALRGDDAQ